MRYVVIVVLVVILNISTGRIFYSKMRVKCESKIVINVSALVPFENVEGLGNDSAELDILRLTDQHCVRGPGMPLDWKQRTRESRGREMCQVDREDEK